MPHNPLVAKPAPIAKEIALWLDADPIMARQVKDYIKPERLVEVLEITAPEPDDFPLSHYANDELLEEIKDRLSENLVSKKSKK